jgi:ABC-type sulfate/molybdate transport systems ATPase subunit
MLAVVSVFSTNGQFVQELVKEDHLNAPWGVALAPRGFGRRTGPERLGRVELEPLYPAQRGGFSPALRENARVLLRLLALVGLDKLGDRPARRLSGGEQQRLALARALARDPAILFLDEPSASLDPYATKAIEDIVHSVSARGVKVIMATHDLGQARRLAGDIVLLNRGRLVAALGALPRSSIFLSVGHSSTMRTSSVAAALAAASTVASVCLGSRESSSASSFWRWSDCSFQRLSEAGKSLAGLLFQLTM